MKCVLFLFDFGKKYDVLTFLLGIQNTKCCKNSLVDIQVVSCGLVEVWRKMTRLLAFIPSPNAAMNDLNNSNTKQGQINVLIDCVVNMPIKKG